MPFNLVPTLEKLRCGKTAILRDSIAIDPLPAYLNSQENECHKGKLQGRENIHCGTVVEPHIPSTTETAAAPMQELIRYFILETSLTTEKSTLPFTSKSLDI